MARENYANVDYNLATNRRGDYIGDSSSIAHQLDRLQKDGQNEYNRIYDQEMVGVKDARGFSSVSNIGVAEARSSRLFENSQSYKDLESAKGRAMSDPWSFYRASAADRLAQTSTNDPTQKYMSRLEQLQSGQFGTGDTSYDWRFQQGQKALERSQAARGLLGSGNAATELVDYGQGQASTEYAAEFQRTLAGLAGVSSAYDASQSRLMQMAGVGNDPLGQSKIDAGITQASIGASASIASSAMSAGSANYRTSEDARQFNVQSEQNNQYQQGLQEMVGKYDWSFD